MRGCYNKKKIKARGIRLQAKAERAEIWLGWLLLRASGKARETIQEL